MASGDANNSHDSVPKKYCVGARLREGPHSAISLIKHENCQEGLQATTVSQLFKFLALRRQIFALSSGTSVIFHSELSKSSSETLSIENAQLII